MTNSKYNPHKRCSCDACMRGLRTKAGHAAQRAANRRLRRADKLTLRLDPINYSNNVVSTGYTD